MGLKLVQDWTWRPQSTICFRRRNGS